MASSPVQLPSSDDGSAGSPPDLTDSDGDVVPALAGRCCLKDCLAPFETSTQLSEALDLWRQWLGGVSHEQHLDHVFQLARDLITASAGSPVVFRFLGQVVCRKAWSRLVQVSCGCIWKMQRSVRAGLPERPQDGRCCNGKGPDASLSVVAFLQDIFDSVAEWMPTESCAVAPAAPALSDWLAAPSGPSATAATGGRNGVRES